MTVTSYIRGRPSYWDGEVWRWSDTKGPASGWGGDERACPKCGMTAKPNGPDPCIGMVAGVVSACCGHGVESPYQKRALPEKRSD